MRPKLLFVTITGILATVIVCRSTLTANAAQTREEAINAQTDSSSDQALKNLAANSDQKEFFSCRISEQY
ncbi:MAG TPA: hypothetical protein DDZ80_11690 [Cyanobacteria bacterium UBA8803]|nr:hypothetical protein [Cyanobacteria bacterium UBA8803]